jgi:hypothetical protein
MTLRIGGTGTANEVITDSQVIQNATYTNVQPEPTSANVQTTYSVNMAGSALEIVTMTGATTFTPTNEAAGRTKVLLLDTSASAHTPTFSGVEYPEGGGVPTWSSYRYWQVYLISWSATTTRAAAIGFST